MSKNLIHSFMNDFVISEIGTNHNQKKSLVKKNDKRKLQKLTVNV